MYLFIYLLDYVESFSVTATLGTTEGFNIYAAQSSQASGIHALLTVFIQNYTLHNIAAGPSCALPLTSSTRHILRGRIRLIR